MVDKNTKLEEIEVLKNNVIADTFMKKGYNTLGEVIDLGLLGYLSEGFTMLDIYHISNLLGNLGYPIIGEEYAMTYEDFEDKELISISDNVDRLSSLRNSIRGKEGFFAEEIVLTQKMMENLEQLFVLKREKNSLKK